MSNCLHCLKSIIRNSKGRSPVYCSNACKMAAYRLRNVTPVLRNNNVTPLLRKAGSLSAILESAREVGTSHCLSCSKSFRSDSLAFVLAQRLKIPNRAFALFCDSGCSSKFYGQLNESLRIDNVTPVLRNDDLIGQGGNQ